MPDPTKADPAKAPADPDMTKPKAPFQPAPPQPAAPATAPDMTKPKAPFQPLPPEPTTLPAPAPAPAPDATATLAAAIKDIQSRINPAPASVPTSDLDKTKPGGVYKVGNKLVNAHGREVDEEGTLLHPEEQRVNEFGQLV